MEHTNLKKYFFIPYSTLDGRSDDTTHNSLRWLYRSATVFWTKNLLSSSYQSASQKKLRQNWIGSKIFSHQKMFGHCVTLGFCLKEINKRTKNFWINIISDSATNQELGKNKEIPLVLASSVYKLYINFNKIIWSRLKEEAR